MGSSSLLLWDGCFRRRVGQWVDAPYRVDPAWPALPEDPDGCPGLAPVCYLAQGDDRRRLVVDPSPEAEEDEVTGLHSVSSFHSASVISSTQGFEYQEL